MTRTAMSGSVTSALGISGSRRTRRTRLNTGIENKEKSGVTGKGEKEGRREEGRMQTERERRTGREERQLGRKTNKGRKEMGRERGSCSLQARADFHC